MARTFSTRFFLDASQSLKGRFTHYQNPWCANQYEAPIHAIGPYLDLHGASVLDWGCGDGHFSYFLAKQRARVQAFALETFTDHYSDFNRELDCKIQFLQGNFSNPVAIPVASGTLDAAFSVGVLEHVRETGGHELSSLKELHRTLKPNGLLFIYHLPNATSWIEASIRCLNRLGVKKWCHQYRYSARDIRDLAHQSGFRVLQVEKYNILPRNFSKSLPAALSRSVFFFHALHSLEWLLSKLFRPFCQNHMAVLQKSQ